jgi:DNA replication protein DnaC
MRERALAMDAKYNDQARRLANEAHQHQPIRLAQGEISTRAQEAVTFARDNAVEREAVADMRQVMTDALRRNLGRTTVEAVTTELRLRQERGEFIDIVREQRAPEATTERMVRMEQENVGLQGGAGTGKTTALSVLREAAERAGFEVRGFTPTTRAAQQLAESGIQTETLQKFLRRRLDQSPDAKRLFVVDESSLASTK